MPITTVTFKVETFIDSHPCGQVTLIDDEAFTNDPVVKESKAAGRYGIPYGYKPQGVQKLEPWRTRQEALAIAAEHGVPLTEEGW